MAYYAEKVLLIKKVQPNEMDYEVVLDLGVFDMKSFGGFKGDHALTLANNLAVRASKSRDGMWPYHKLEIEMLGFPE